MGAETEQPQRADEAVFEPAHDIGRALIADVHDQISDELAGAVVRRVPSAVHRDQWYLMVAAVQVGGIGALPVGDDRGMAEKEQPIADCARAPLRVCTCGMR